MTTFIFSNRWEYITAFYNWAAENRDELFSAEFILDKQTQKLNMYVTVNDAVTALRIKLEFAEMICNTIK